MNTNLLFVHALTPLQPGTGQGLGIIDMPIAREVATNLPYLPGSSLKGVLRDQCADPEMLFGPESDDIKADNLVAGEAQFTDQRLLLFPVRSLSGVFAWTTSPYLLKRFKRECLAAGKSDFPEVIPEPAILNPGSDDIDFQALIGSSKKLTVGSSGKIVLEDIDMTAKESEDVVALAGWLGKELFPDDEVWQKLLAEKICIVPDDIFTFLVETATEIIARNRIQDETKTVAKGGLWYEEALPAETVLYGLIGAQKIAKNGRSTATILDEIRKLFSQNEALQLGGNSSIGRGLCRIVVTN